MKSEKVFIGIIIVLVTALVFTSFNIPRRSNQQLRDVVKLLEQSGTELDKLRESIENQGRLLEEFQQHQSEFGDVIGRLTGDLQGLRDIEIGIRESQIQSDGWIGTLRNSIGDIRTVIEATLEGIKDQNNEDDLD